MRAHVAMLLLLGCGGSTEPARTPLPGAVPWDAATASRVAEAIATAPEQSAREAPRYTNRLILEASPYLRQHAHNPVDWRPWGAAAFAEAEALGRPVFLSIGYSTCHWCHVMAEESFEDEAIAAFLNANFVPVKVDRDERPDVDAVYLRAVQALTGRGGWPMTLVLTPDRVPVFGGTYLPPRAGARGAQKGLLEVVTELSGRWATDRAALATHAEEVSRRMEVLARPPTPGDLPGEAALDAARGRFEASWDDRFGGFSKPPKFPEPLELRWLLAESRRTGDPKAQQMALHTLDAVLAGSVRDPIGGGFHRYATDAAWSVPHFEKMLYDQALMATVLVEAWQVTGETRYADAARETLDFTIRELRGRDGGFGAALDADGEGPGGRQEGAFYTWTPEELAAVLGDRAPLAQAWFGIAAAGPIDGRSAPSHRRTVPDLAAELGRDEGELAEAIAQIRKDLFRARSKRPAPFRDDTVVLAWNALAISALARAGFALDEPMYLETARGAARLIHRQMVDPEGRLVRTRQADRLGPPAVLEDQALHVQAMLDLFEATGEVDWLRLATRSAEQLELRFADPVGGWWETAHDAEPLLTRGKPWSDVTTPSGNGAATEALLRLHALTGEARWRARADAALALFSNNLDKQGSAAPSLLIALDRRLADARQVVLVPGTGADAMRAELRASLPSARVQAPLPVPPDGRMAGFPLLEGKVARDGLTTAYVCHDGLCEAPTTDPAVFRVQLARRPDEPGAP